MTRVSHTSMEPFINLYDPHTNPTSIANELTSMGYTPTSRTYTRPCVYPPSAFSQV
jgi:hypothetical protein